MGDDAMLETPARELTVLGEPITIRPITIGQYPAFARAVRPLMAVVDGEAGEVDVIGLIAEHGEALIEAACVATGRERAWMAGLPPDAFVDLAQAVIEVNLDFFVRRLLPRIQAATDSLSKAVGETSSNR